MRHLLPLALVLSLAPLALRAAEVKVARADVPAPVLEALRKQYPAAKELGFVKEVEHGKVAYEAKLQDGDALREVSWSADGTLLSEETTVAPAALPEPVKRGFAASRYAHWTLQKAEQLAEGAERKLTWELAVHQRGKAAELVFDASGKLLSEKRETGKE